MKRVVLFVSVLVALSAVAWSLTNVPGNAISSSKHYRTSGVGNATGRAGSAAMTARALLGKDGNTTVEVTTGALDSSATPPGSFGKVQYKPFDSAGNVLFAQNFNPLSNAGGYYTFVSPSLHRAQQIQLQGNIAGIDNRNDVVTVVETVKLRPDFAVKGLLLPNSAMLTQPVNISANIVELNGDASATTTCVLAIDGNNVDQANNVYVDAGGSVSCAFEYTFSTTGSHTVQVTAASVVPADWDNNNNSISGVITITNIGTAQYGFASFTGSDFSYSNSYSNEIWAQGYIRQNESDYSATTLNSQSSLAVFSSAGCTGATDAVLWQFPLTLSYSETMDGTLVYSFTDTGISGSIGSESVVGGTICNIPVTSFTNQSANNYSVDHWNFFFAGQAYDAQGTLVYSQQIVQSMRNAGDVSYFSTGYQCLYWYFPTCDSPSDYYAWNSSSGQTLGTVIPLGNTWIPSMTTVDSAGFRFSGTVSVPLTTIHNTYSQPNSCNSYGPDPYGFAYQTCSSSTESDAESNGSASK
jgi:hypothetical protein